MSHPYGKKVHVIIKEIKHKQYTDPKTKKMTVQPTIPVEVLNFQDPSKQAMKWAIHTILRRGHCSPWEVMLAAATWDKQNMQEGRGYKISINFEETESKGNKNGR